MIGPFFLRRRVSARGAVHLMASLQERVKALEDQAESLADATDLDTAWIVWCGVLVFCEYRCIFSSQIFPPLYSSTRAGWTRTAVSSVSIVSAWSGRQQKSPSAVECRRFHLARHHPVNIVSSAAGRLCQSWTPRLHPMTTRSSIMRR